MDRPTIAILASGEGTTAEAVIRASAQKAVSFDVGIIIASNESAGIFSRVRTCNQQYSLNIPCMLGANDDEIQSILNKYQPDLIALMGYMKKIGPGLVNSYGWRPEYTRAEQAMLVNTHPGLLPITKGLYGIHVQKFVLDSHLPYSGQTLHIVSEHYDEGPVVTEHKVAVEPDDTPERLFERVKIAEKKNLPYDLADFMVRRRSYLEGDDNG